MVQYTHRCSQGPKLEGSRKSEIRGVSKLPMAEVGKVWHSCSLGVINQNQHKVSEFDHETSQGGNWANRAF